MEDLEPLTGADTIERGDYDPNAITQGNDELLPGSMLSGRYLVKRKLGRGGFGVVYLAADEKMLSRPVVIKALLDGELKNEWTLRKFKQEIEALARIDHPSIVGILDAGELTDGKPYIVMQYVDGFSLRTVITPEGMDFWRASNIIKQIGRALTAAHERGILHRDLKPENIMIQALGDGEEQVKIIDFGVARVKDSVISMSTASDRTVGTIAYMSPEQLSAGPLSQASDVYCFGVIAYELLTGRRPANPESAYQLLEMQRSGVRVKPVDLRPGLPPQAESIILKALSFEAKDRYQRARDFGDLLSSALLGDEEQTVLAGPSLPKKPNRAEISVSVPETAHVLFMDIVGYSKMMVDEQPACLQKLQSVVGLTEDFNRAQATNQLIRLPTGDGIALVFFGDPEAPVRCAVDIAYGLKESPEVKLRMGVHSGLVYRMADINTNMNVAGGGINIAQRVMDCGDAGHILVSKRVADDLIQLARWAPCLHELGEAEVKHGVRVPLFNLYTDEVGNPEIPAKLRPPGTRIAPRGMLKVAALVLGLVSLVLGAYFFLNRETRSGPGPVTGPAAVSERSLTYSVTVQQMANRQTPIGSPYEAAGNEYFGDGWKFRFNIEPAQQGFLYLLNEDSAPGNKPFYNVLFPTQENNAGVAQLAANQRMEAGWYYFVEEPGVEKLWLIWSAEAITDLDSIFQKATKTDGVISEPSDVAKVRSYLKQHESQPPKVVSDQTQKRTVVTGKGDKFVALVELAHLKR